MAQAESAVDHTEVLEVEAPRRLVLRARARPLGTAIIRMELTPQGDGTAVTMTEVAGDPLSRVVLNPLTYPLVHRRNVRALRRLKRIAETGIMKT